MVADSMGLELLNKTISEINELVRNREITYLDLINEIETSIKEQEEKLGCYITLEMEEAKEKAQNIPPGTDGLLTGVPLSVKDTFTTKGIRTTTASKILENFIPPYDATAYARLKSAGVILTGKTNMDEFAHGFTTEHSAFHITRNPWNLNMIPGGSSGGAAASVAARECFIALASENFGSIIQPASYCGVVGMKPTYGLSSRYGIIAMASSLECPGIIGRNVEDVALGIETIGGQDIYDATSVEHESESYWKNINKVIKDKKVAIIEPFFSLVEDEVAGAIKKFGKDIENLGADIELIKWYDLDIDSEIYDILYRAEVSSNLARYDGIRYGYKGRSKGESHLSVSDINTKVFKSEGLNTEHLKSGEFKSSDLNSYYLNSREAFGSHVKRQILTDPVTLSQKSADDIYTNALRLRRVNRDYIDRLFEKYDAIVTPTSVFVSLELGKVDDSEWRKNNTFGQQIGAILCPTVLYGYPAITFPVNIAKNGMPVGIQLFTKRFNEQELFNIAYAYENAYPDFHMMRP